MLENASAIGLPVPQKIIDMLGQLKEGGGKEKEQPKDESEKTE